MIDVMKTMEIKVQVPLSTVDNGWRKHFADSFDYHVTKHTHKNMKSSIKWENVSLMKVFHFVKLEFISNNLQLIATRLTFTCSKSTIKTLKKGVKNVQS